jgi:hypothetical protein
MPGNYRVTMKPVGCRSVHSSAELVKQKEIRMKRSHYYQLHLPSLSRTTKQRTNIGFEAVAGVGQHFKDTL